MFEGKDRPSGWEFACCDRCNEGSRGSDAVAQLFALIEPISVSGWKGDQISRAMAAVRKQAPKVLSELSPLGKSRPVLLNRKGLLHEAVELKADGPATKAHLDVFAAKMAMATFATYIGRPMNMDGIIYTQWFLNRGMGQDAYHASLSIMPSFDELRQGRKTSGKQFHLHYNTDLSSLIVGLISFHGCLTVMLVASDGDEFRPTLDNMLQRMIGPHRPGSQLTEPGLPNLEFLRS
ncbi:hypothetical protein [Pseudooceanicola algae]|nr:hypothetical protein [Pseudooceanicola algae]